MLFYSENGLNPICGFLEIGDPGNEPPFTSGSFSGGRGNGGEGGFRRLTHSNVPPHPNSRAISLERNLPSSAFRPKPRMGLLIQILAVGGDLSHFKKTAPKNLTTP